MGGRKWTDLCKCFTGFPACSRHTRTDTGTHTHTSSRIYINYINSKGQTRKNRSHVFETHRHTERAVPGGMIDDWLGFVFGEVVGFKLFDRRDSWPVLLCRCSWSHTVTHRLPRSIKQVITCGETSELLKRSCRKCSPSSLKMRWSSSSTVEPGNRGRPAAIS